MEIVKTHNFKTSQEAWEGLNEYFLMNESEILKREGGRYGPQLISYKHYIVIDKAWVDPDFDFGNVFGYRMQKWSSLVNNYVDMNFLDILKSEVAIKLKKRNNSYNLSMRFDNSHGSGKNCLLSLTVSKRVTSPNPIMIFNLRSSEITKRLLLDFLLVQRIAEYIFGKKQKVSIEMFCGNVYQNTEAFTMYDNHKSIDKLLKKVKKLDSWQKRLLETLHNFKTVNPKDITYKVHLRAVRQLQRPNGIPLSGDRPMTTKELLIYGKDCDYPEDCITPKQRKQHNKKIKKLYARKD